MTTGQGAREGAGTSPAPYAIAGQSRSSRSLRRAETSARRVSSLPTEGREEAHAAGAGAKRGIRRTVERASARAERRRPKAAIPRAAQATC